MGTYCGPCSAGGNPVEVRGLVGGDVQLDVVKMEVSDDRASDCVEGEMK